LGHGFAAADTGVTLSNLTAQRDYSAAQLVYFNARQEIAIIINSLICGLFGLLMALINRLNGSNTEPF
jgi:hypothetical protein